MRDNRINKRSAGPVAVLSSAIVAVGRAELGESRTAFASRAGVSVELIAAAEDGKQPAWGIQAPEIFQITEAFLPATADLFWGAALADLLIQEVTEGDYASAAATAATLLNDAEDAGTGRALLLIAIRGGTGVIPGAGESWRLSGPLLPEAARQQFRCQVTTLAESESPDSWVGAELLALFGDAL